MGGEIQSAELQTLEFHPVEFYDMSISDHVHDELVLERSRRNLMALHAHQHGHAAANAEATLASMCPRDSPAISNSTASASCVQPDHGIGTTSRTSTGCYQEGFAKASAEASGPRAATQGTLVPTPNNGHASELTTLASGERSWSLGALRCVQLSSVPKEGKSQWINEGREPGDDPTNASASPANDEWVQAQPADLPGDGQADRGRGSAGHQHQPGGGCSGLQQCLHAGKGKPQKSRLLRRCLQVLRAHGGAWWAMPTKPNMGYHEQNVNNDQ